MPGTVSKWCVFNREIGIGSANSSPYVNQLSLSLLTILIVLFKTSAVWLISNSPTILLGSAIAFNRSCKQVYRMWDGMSAFKPSPVIKSNKLSYCCKQCSMTLLRKASALHVYCSIMMGLGRDPLSLSTSRVGSRATTTLLKKHLPSGLVLYTERPSHGDRSIVSLRGAVV